MKNIHILPTDKASRLFTYKDESYLYYIKKDIDSKSKNENCQNQNIYITSDEEIKEGDWVIYKEDNSIIKMKTKLSVMLGHSFKTHKKIILTTDQDLIKDGVQEIDDKFLKWLVKNPSCEEIGIEKGYAFGTFYKIIIPKEEPKYPIGGYAPGNYMCNCSTCKTQFQGDKRAVQCEPCAIEMVQEQNIIDMMKGDEELGMYDEILPQQIWNKEKMEGIKQLIQDHKKETLEEAAIDYCDRFFGKDRTTHQWNNGYTTFINSAKWQLERSYSEEDMREAFIAGGNSQIEEDDAYGNAYFEYMEEWFEQFKKK